MPVQVLRALPAFDMPVLTEGKNIRKAAGICGKYGAGIKTLKLRTVSM